ncbi:hypothetical protein PR002_g19159 [Phytophthora rubi]|uniref:Uncharacterized protein n=1 Tax=Phytophthora rubi TaxID=129364 RepID=A0A6A3JP76_9STRA|nr:hypothetical protein PR002_g19159 [Phytophthora rubi]
MDVVCSFGRSVDVDGDEWIDLGLPPDSEDVDESAPTQVLLKSADNDDNNPFAAQETSKKTPVTLVTASTQPVPEPEPEQSVGKTQPNLSKKNPQDPRVKTVPALRKPSRAPPAPVVMSKAARSKEALMAFYLGRAKQMEAKHQNMIVSPAKPRIISERSAPIGH